MSGAHQYADEAAPHSDTPTFTPLTALLLPSALVSTHTQAGGPGLTSVRFCPLASSLLDCYSSSQHTEMHTHTDTHTHTHMHRACPRFQELVRYLNLFASV